MADLSSSGEGQRGESVSRCNVRSFGFTKEDRVRRSSDYQRITKSGVRRRTAHFTIRMLENGLGRTRLGIAVSKKVGNACARNRIKRRLREYFRLRRDILPPDTDIVFVAMHGAATLDTKQLSHELDRFFDR